MGRIADAIDQIEDELEDANKEVIRLETINTELNERIDELARIVEQYNAMEDYLEEYHPGLITAFEVATRMEK